MARRKGLHKLRKLNVRYKKWYKRLEHNTLLKELSKLILNFKEGEE